MTATTIEPIAPDVRAQRPEYTIPGVYPRGATVGFYAGELTASVREQCLNELQIPAAADGRAEAQRLLGEFEAAFAATEVSQRAKAAEGRAAAARASQDQTQAALADAVATIEAALRSGESTKKAESERNRLESELRELARRLPILDSEARERRKEADAERRRLLLEFAGRQHKLAEAELSAARTTLAMAMLPCLAAVVYWSELSAGIGNASR